MILPVILLACSTLAPPSTVHPTPLPALIPFLNALALNMSVPAISISYIRGDGPIYASQGGTGLRTGRPLDSYARFHHGSVGKVLTAAAANILHIRGQVNLSEPIAPWFAEESWGPSLPTTCTGWDLLLHTSGVQDYIFTDQYIAWAKRTQPHDRFAVLYPDELVEIGLKQGFSAPPGTEYKYSETGYLLAGLLCEKVLGGTLPHKGWRDPAWYADSQLVRFIKANVLTPTGGGPFIRSTTQGRLFQNLTQGYVGSALGLQLFHLLPGGLDMATGSIWMNPSFEWASGGWLASPFAMANVFHRLIVAGGVLPDGWYRHIVFPKKNKGAETSLGLRVETFGKNEKTLQRYGKWGVYWIGTESLVFSVPEENATLSVSMSRLNNDETIFQIWDKVWERVDRLSSS